MRLTKKCIGKFFSVTGNPMDDVMLLLDIHKGYILYYDFGGKVWKQTNRFDDWNHVKKYKLPKTERRAMWAEATEDAK